MDPKVALVTTYQRIRAKEHVLRIKGIPFTKHIFTQDEHAIINAYQKERKLIQLYGSASPPPRQIKQAKTKQNSIQIERNINVKF